MGTRRSRAGLTLAEAIMAIFVMAAGFIVAARLFQTGLRYQTIIDSRTLAVVIAERQMERVRGWSRRVHGPGGGKSITDWSGCPGVGATTTDADYPGYSIEVEQLNKQIYSPCSLFEVLQVPDLRRVIKESMREIRVTVRWGSEQFSTSESRNQVYTLVSLVGLPTGEPRTGTPATVTLSTGGTIPATQTFEATSQAFNNDGRQLSDLFFLYSIRPSPGGGGGGNGAIAQARDGRRADLRNCIYDIDPVTNAYTIGGFGFGRCRVVATGIYRGKVVAGISDEIEMAP